ncbi:MAG: hypothetical protein HY601_01765 [Candidatus Omnitrophica bacterium]|nr:hypothetical protein [Candidatus Omnitrophota bacterium]
MRDERGAVLGIVIITAVVAAIAAAAALQIAIAQSRHARAFRERARAQAAAEAGLVWAMEQLRADSTLTFDAPVDVVIPGITSVEDIPVDIVPTCAAPCQNRTLRATVVYR